ncbi:hypothetical protein M405DRAFT_745486, partial [Rhizopogon salebrosus TDB-379]
FDLPVMKLLILHVFEHHDEHVVHPIWDRIFDDAIEKGGDAQTNADHIIATVVPLGKRFYQSESAFPLSESKYTNRPSSNRAPRKETRPVPSGPG